MPRIVYNPVDRRPAPPASIIVIRLFGLVVMAFSLLGVAYLLMSFSGGSKKPDWNWDPASVRTNFEPIYTPEQLERIQRENMGRAFSLNNVPQDPIVKPPVNAPSNAPGLPVPFGGNEPRPIPVEPGGVDQRELWAQRDERHLDLARQLKDGHAFNLIDEVANILDFQPFTDSDRTRLMAEFAANRGRQADPYERLALKVLRAMPKLGSTAWADYEAKINRDAFLYAPGMPAIDVYRGRVFGVQGRLFDLYEVRPDAPIILADGSKVESYFEGVVALLGKGVGRDEHAVEQRLVMFQTLSLGDDLKPLLNAQGNVSQADRLVSDAVMVKLSGAYLRLWIYSREVAPFSSAAKPALCQAHLPLLLTADVARAQGKPYELTDELLQQVRDAMREDPIFVESEAAYYAMLAKANDPQDEVTPVDSIGYFDLAGGQGETGPRYRGQGIRIVGMIGDDFAPVILPPNISGMRRVFRALVLGDTGDVNSPKKYLVDMLEPPTGLEPRALVGFNARYYRNVFETKSTSSDVRPLLIVRRVSGLREGKDETDWVFVLVGVAAFIGLFVALLWFVMSDRRERKAFEATTMDVARKRLEKRGGLKLKPLPGDKPAAAGDEAPDKPPEPPPAG